MNLEEEINSCQTQIDLMEEKAKKQNYLKGYYQQNREKIRLQQREYNQRPHVKARKKEQNHKYEQKPERKEYLRDYKGKHRKYHKE